MGGVKAPPFVEREEMLAKVKSKSRLKVVMAFTGREFVNYEYRSVPEGDEVEALTNPYLETLDKPVEEPTETDVEPIDGIQEMNVKDAGGYIVSVDNIEELYSLLDEEINSKNRTSILKKIESRINHLESQEDE